MLRSRRTAAAAATTFGAITALVLTAPSAPAAITDFTVAPGLGSSTSYGTGCSYTATATATPGDYVSFYDSQNGSFDPPGAIQVPSSGKVTAQWTPASTGVHNLHAVQIGGQRDLQVTVGTGVKLGPICLVT
ncbi:hypothetical protein [Nocardia sp. NPDC050406]|uniref:hypothetical protein n=1 Tax=Nocardia sp. NPDC050406 TaxID=3364318 RepID=UPI00379601DC